MGSMKGHIIDLVDYANAERAWRSMTPEQRVKCRKDHPITFALIDIGNMVFIFIPALIIGGGLVWLLFAIFGWWKILAFFGICLVLTLFSKK